MGEPTSHEGGSAPRERQALRSLAKRLLRILRTLEQGAEAVGQPGRSGYARRASPPGEGTRINSNGDGANVTP